MFGEWVYAKHTIHYRKLQHFFFEFDVYNQATEHCWKLIAEEQGCFDVAYSFQSDHARLAYFRQSEPNLHYVPYEDFSATVTLTAGLPGSVKDYWIAKNRSQQRLFLMLGLQSPPGDCLRRTVILSNLAAKSKSHCSGSGMGNTQPGRQMRASNAT